MTTPTNILMIVADDLNDWIEPLGGHPQAYTPNMTRLADRSVVFETAMIAAPACSASRTATLYGQAPWRTGSYSNQSLWTDVYPADQRLSFVGRLRDERWNTLQFGKVAHSINDMNDWSYMLDLPAEKYSPISQAVQQNLVNSSFDFGVCPPGTPAELTDEEQARLLCGTMHVGAERHLWTLGLHRPHSPFVIHQEYFSHIPAPVSQPPGVNGTFDPYNDACLAGIPAAAIQRIIGPNRKVPRAFYDTGEYLGYVRAYLAAVAYMDSLVGKMLDQLDTCGLTDNTMVVFWSDNGEQLGEKQCGRKFTLWERCLRVPFMIAGPGIVPRRVSDPVSLLDLYPTLAETFDFAPPHSLDGESLVPVLNGGSMTRVAATSAWSIKNDTKVAATVRTATHRLTRYWDGSLELYDHTVDQYEHVNLAAVSPRPAETQAIIDAMLPLLPATMALPINGAGDEE